MPREHFEELEVSTFIDTQKLLKVLVIPARELLPIKGKRRFLVEL